MKSSWSTDCSINPWNLTTVPGARSAHAGELVHEPRPRRCLRHQSLCSLLTGIQKFGFYFPRSRQLEDSLGNFLCSNISVNIVASTKSCRRGSTWHCSTRTYKEWSLSDMAGSKTLSSSTNLAKTLYPYQSFAVGRVESLGQRLEGRRGAGRQAKDIDGHVFLTQDNQNLVFKSKSLQSAPFFV
jgi:hypothetical protein